MQKRVILVTDEALGRGDTELGKRLMNSFFAALASQAEKPEAIFLVNGGVRLACRSSACLGNLSILEEMGVDVLACQTCVLHFGLADELEVGEISSMKDLASLVSRNEVVTVG